MLRLGYDLSTSNTYLYFSMYSPWRFHIQLMESRELFSFNVGVRYKNV